MRLIAGLAPALLALAACGGVAAPPQATPAPSLPALPAVDSCGAGAQAAVIGQPATALERIYILRQVRLIRPGQPVTEDHRPDRINFHIDSAERITAISCG